MIAKVAHLPARPVRYLETGSGSAVVFIHAFPLSADQWLPQLARIPPGWRAVAPDLRGLGGSDPGGGAVTIDTHADDILALMSHLGIERGVVAGLSMGGYVAFAMLRKAPERVAGLVLADTRAGADGADARAGRDRTLALLEREGPGGIARAMVPKLLARETLREQPDLAEVVTRLIEANTAAGIRAAVVALKERPDSTGLLASIRCPALIVCGEEDALTPPAESEAMHRAIAGSQLAIIPRAGHLSNLENPLAFNDALRGSGLFSTDSARSGPGLR